MITLSLYETPEELEVLKQRAETNEKVYTVIDNKTVQLLKGNKARIATKSEVDNFIKTFPLEAPEEEAEAEDNKEDVSNDEGEETRVPEEAEDRFCLLEKRVSKIEEALRKPIL